MNMRHLVTSLVHNSHFFDRTNDTLSILICYRVVIYWSFWPWISKKRYFIVTRWRFQKRWWVGSWPLGNKSNLFWKKIKFSDLPRRSPDVPVTSITVDLSTWHVSMPMQRKYSKNLIFRNWMSWITRNLKKLFIWTRFTNPPHCMLSK